MAQYSIGVDLGGTNLRAAAIDETGKILEKVTGQVHFSEGRDAIIGDIANSIRSVEGKCGADGLVGLGIGVPGFILLEKGVIVGSHNLPDFNNFPVRDAIEAKLGGTKVFLENDANAAALGEKWMGAGREVNDLVLLTLGTGIGGGIIHNGAVLHGFVGMAGELGHITVDLNGNPCGCGNYGCLEKHASATAVEAMAQLLHLGEGITAEGVYKLAIGGNENAQRIFGCMGQALGIGLAMLVNTFNFPLYLLSGGMLPAWDLFTPKMFEELNRRSFTYRNVTTRVEKAILGNEAGLFGAAYLPFLAKSKKS